MPGTSVEKRWEFAQQVFDPKFYSWIVDVRFEGVRMEEFVADFSFDEMYPILASRADEAARESLETSIKFDLLTVWSFSFLLRLPLSIILLVVANLNYKDAFNLYRTCRKMYTLLALRVTGQYARLRNQRHEGWKIQLALKVIEMKKGTTLAHETKVRLRDECLTPLGIAGPLDETLNIPFWEHMYGRKKDKREQQLVDEDGETGAP